MMDQVLELWVGSLIEMAKVRGMRGSGRRWRPGKPLEFLVAAYNGARNTGEDVRVEEIVRQIRAILGEKNVRLSVPTLNFDLTRGYFGNAAQVQLPYVFPPFLSREVPKYDGVVACLGPTFSTKFASAVNTLMVGALGVAAVQNKLSVAYGVEAGPIPAGGPGAARPRVRREGSARRRLGWPPLGPGPVPHQPLLVAGETFA